LLGVWIFLWCLHGDNDGLWFQGDAPRHAANGFFWIDYLSDFTWDAKGYALRYYARYPVIDPTSRPPVFYLLEGVAFRLCGPSPYVAKGLVLCFSLLAALYLMAWLRRWVSAEAAYAAALFLLLPGVICWSHAIMLNIPALAFGLAALFHTRRWLEAVEPRRGQLAAAAALTLLGILTYYPTGVVVLVVAVWMAIKRDWSGWRNPLLWTVVGTCGLMLLPFAWLVAHWAPIPLGWVLPSAANFGKLSTWLFYPSRILQIANWQLGCLAGLGLVAGLAHRRWRQEAVLSASWILVLYVVFSILHAKDVRYALPVMAPLLVLATLGVTIGCEWLARLRFLRASAGRRLTTVVLLALLAYQSYWATVYRVVSIRGYPELVSYLGQVAPDEPVLYDGFYDGVFTFYLRAADHHFRRRVVLGSKLLYAYAMIPGWKQRDFVHSAEEVIDVLQQRGGCRWLAIEVSQRDHDLLPMRYLRDAVNTPAFELVKSFPIDGPLIKRVDVYRLTMPVAEVQEVDLPFPALGPDVTYRVRPIAMRKSP
jgi:hypothetical protein